MATKAQIAQACTILSRAYPNSRIVPGGDGAPGTMDIYAEMLSDLDGADLLDAVKYCLTTEKAFMPSIATIREAAEKIRVTRNGGELSGQEAWGQVLKQIAAVGSYGSPEFTDDRVTRAVNCIGWRIICMSDEQDPSIRFQFIKAFETFVARSKTEAVVAMIESPNVRALGLMGSVAKQLERGQK